MGTIIKVNMSELQQKVATLRQSFTELEEATKAAQRAGLAAISAGGGLGTGVGAAINEAINEISMDQLKQAREELEQMITNLNTASNEYSKKNDELIASIKAIAAGQGNGNGTITGGVGQFTQ
jgi:prefoldin subunit 5